MIAQEVIVAKSQELHQVVDELVTIVVDAIRDHTPIHKVEGKGMKILLQAGQKALQLLVDCLGNGDMGQEYQLPDGTTVKRSEQPQPRDYVSIFGKIDIRRVRLRPTERPSDRVRGHRRPFGLASRQILVPVAGLGPELCHGRTVWPGGEEGPEDLGAESVRGQPGTHEPRDGAIGGHVSGIPSGSSREGRRGDFRADGRWQRSSHPTARRRAADHGPSAPHRSQTGSQENGHLGRGLQHRPPGPHA